MLGRACFALPRPAALNHGHASLTTAEQSCAVPALRCPAKLSHAVLVRARLSLLCYAVHRTAQPMLWIAKPGAAWLGWACFAGLRWLQLCRDALCQAWPAKCQLFVLLFLLSLYAASSCGALS